MKKLIAFSAIGLCFAASAFADQSLTRNDCLAGDLEDRLILAAHLVSQLAKDPNSLTPETALATVELANPSTQIYQQLGDQIHALGCAFTPKAQFNTVKDAIYALADHAMKVEQDPNSAPAWLKEGFKAVIAGNDNPKGRIFIDTTADGFKFYACEPDTSSGEMPHVGPGCAPLMDDTFVVPVDELLKKADGTKHAILVVLKTIGQISVTFTSNLGLNIFSPIAQTISAMIDPNPLNILQRDHKISVAVDDLFTLGNNNPANLKQADFLITRRLPFKYADLKQALIDVLSEIDTKEYKELEKYRSSHNPSAKETAEYKEQLNFHNEVLQDYQAGLEADKKKTPPSEQKP